MANDESEGTPGVLGRASRWLVAICALVGLLVGLFIFASTTEVYEAIARVQVSNPPGTMGDEIALMQSDRVSGPAAAQLGFTPDVTLEGNENAGLINIRSRSSLPQRAADGASVLAETYRQVQTDAAVAIAQVPAVPTEPVSPRLGLHILVGSALGALIGAALAAATSVRRAITPTTGSGEQAASPIRPPATGRPSLVPTETPKPDPRRAYDQRLDVVDAEPAAEIDLRDQFAAPGPAPERPIPQPAAVDAAHSDLRATQPTAQPSTQAAERTPGAGPVNTTVDVAATFSSAASSMLAEPQAKTALWNDGDGEAVGNAQTASVNPNPTDTTTATDGADPTLDAADIDEVGEAATGGAENSAGDRPEGTVDEILSFEESIADPMPAAAPAAQPPRPEGGTQPLPTDIEDAEVDDIDDPFDETDSFVDLDGFADDESTRAALHPVSDEALSIIEARHSAAVAELRMAAEQTLSSTRAMHEREMSVLKAQLSDANKRVRTAEATLRRQAGDDQHRVGDLQAQVDALAAELTAMRSQHEKEQVERLHEMTTERETSDNALANERRKHLAELTSRERQHRSALAANRRELEQALADGRTEQQQALDRQHLEYEAALVRDRERHAAELKRLTEQHESALASLQASQDQLADRQIRQTKETMAELRTSQRALTKRVEESESNERQLRRELSSARQQLREGQQRGGEREQELRDELAKARKDLQSERERNAALREDVVRRTAEAHQAVDRATEERSAQLADLEALVARQREQAEQRIREANEAAEIRAREATRREAELSATIARLERELGQRGLTQ